MSSFNALQVISTCVRLCLCSPRTSMSWDQSLHRIYCFPVGILHKWPTRWNTAMPHKCFLHAWKSCKQDFDVARSLYNQSILVHQQLRLQLSPLVFFLLRPVWWATSSVTGISSGKHPAAMPWSKIHQCFVRLCLATKSFSGPSHHEGMLEIFFAWIWFPTELRWSRQFHNEVSTASVSDATENPRRKQIQYIQ